MTLNDPEPQRTRFDRQRSRAGIVQRDRIIWKQCLRGIPLGDIANEHDLTENQVRAIFKKQEHRWNSIDDRDVRILKKEHTELLEDVANELREAWTRSQQPAVETTTGNAMLNARTGEVVDLPDRVVTKPQVGNPSYLSQYAATLKQIRQIWGADEPEKQEIAILDEDAKQMLDAKMSELMNRTKAADNRITEGEARHQQLPMVVPERDALKEQLLTSKKEKVDKKLILLPSQKAETTEHGIDLPGEGMDLDFPLG